MDSGLAVLSTTNHFSNSSAYDVLTPQSLVSARCYASCTCHAQHDGSVHGEASWLPCTLFIMNSREGLTFVLQAVVARACYELLVALQCHWHCMGSVHRCLGSGCA